MSRKRGKLSTEEERFILASKDHLTVEQIAEQINRTSEPVARFLREHANMSSFPQVVDESSNDNELRKHLRSRPYWNEVKKQFSDDELEYFVKGWVEFMKQFQRDTYWSEELEVKQWLTFEIIMNRSNIERKKSIDEIERISNLVTKEYQKPAEERDPQLQFYEEQLMFYKNAIQAYTNELTKLQAQIKDIKRDLKAARADRTRRLEEGKQTFIGLVKMLDEESLRESHGWDAEIMSVAAKKAKFKHSEYHEFLDGKLAQPFLNHETVIGDESDE